MRFKGLDLNLLVALDALLEEKSVSKTAQRLHLSQPAMSAALGRLRDYFNDPILKMHGKRMVPTAHAIRISGELKTVLASLDSLIARSTQFDPEASTRKFTITVSDYLMRVIFVPLMPKLLEQAPNIQLDMVPPDDSSIEFLDQGKTDLILIPKQMRVKDHPSEFLFKDTFVVVGCLSNPVFKTGITEEIFYDASHVIVKLGHIKRLSVSEQLLEARGKKRKSDILITSFLLAPEMIIYTNKLTVMHKTLAVKFAETLPIAIAEMPFDFPGLEEYAQFNRTRNDDLGVRWLIDEIKKEMNSRSV